LAEAGVPVTDRQEVERLSDLTRSQRSAYLESMADVGQAVERACAEADPAFRRVNMEILGNTGTFLHAHFWARYGWEPSELVHTPVWLYPPESWSDSATALGPQHDVLRASVARHLMSLH
jgi:diadenosine tetraphosphate (Ap4A) HIT family hydrolase